MNAAYLATARLLVEVAPVVFDSGIFALKGGTAINLFLRDMPRLSVDLDLVFTDYRPPRAAALTAINEALRTARDRLARRGLTVQARSAADMGETKLLIQRDALSVKVEVNTVLRGTVHPAGRMPSCRRSAGGCRIWSTWLRPAPRGSERWRMRWTRSWRRRCSGKVALSHRRRSNRPEASEAVRGSGRGAGGCHSSRREKSSIGRLGPFIMAGLIITA